MSSTSTNTNTNTSTTTTPPQQPPPPEPSPKWPPFNPFTRHPTPPLGKLKMVLFGPILVPIRIIGALSSLTAVLVWVNVCSLGCDPTLPYTPIRRRILLGGVRVCSRSLLFFYGFPWICVKHVAEEEEEGGGDGEGKKPAAAAAAAAAVKAAAPILVSNHIGFSETLYLSAYMGCCFISKGANRSLPFIGRVIEVIQSVQVFRRPDSDHHSNNKTKNSTADGAAAAPPSATQIVLNRAKDPEGTWPPLATFPEGTTTNGRALIGFRTGVFLAGTPVQPIIFKMPFSPLHGYDPSFTCGNIFLCVLGLMTQPINHMHVTHLPIYHPSPAEKSDPKLYASNVRDVMAKALGVDCYPSLSYVDKLPYEPSESLREKGRVMLRERNGGVDWVEPVFWEDGFGNRVGVGKKDL